MCASNISNIPYEQFFKLYTVVKEIGSGSYGQVFKIKSNETGKYYAFKKIIIQPEEDPGEVIAEILNYKTMEHELVIKVAPKTNVVVPVLLQCPHARQSPQRP
jgi:serine/threonine protein kinase